MDNTGTEAEPGNQLAALETRVMFRALGAAFSLYGQALAEDEEVTRSIDFRSFGAHS